MKVPPSWKVKRELRRLASDAMAAPRRAAWYLFSTLYYDRFLSRSRVVWDGSKQMSSKVAVMVIYPADGLLRSHLLTLEHLLESGYSPVVVSNLSLPEFDRSRVLACCASYIERPNFGYDFGAYRDGVLSIADKLKGLDRLVLMNDSVWYPLPGTANWLETAEQLSADFVGAVSNYGTPRCDPGEFRKLDWTYSADHPNFHYCSFALSIGSNILHSEEFRRFWSDFRLDNEKKRVVRRGEIGLTQWVLKNRFTHAATCPPQTLDDVLSGLTNERLKQVLHRTIFPDSPRGEAEKKRVLEIPMDHPGWRGTAIQFILMAASLQGTGYALPELTTKEMSFPFLKKSPLKLAASGAKTTRELIDEIPGDVGKIIQSEADMVRRQ